MADRGSNVHGRPASSQPPPPAFPGYAAVWPGLLGQSPFVPLALIIDLQPSTLSGVPIWVINYVTVQLMNTVWERSLLSLKPL